MTRFARSSLVRFGLLSLAAVAPVFAAQEAAPAATPPPTVRTVMPMLSKAPRNYDLPGRTEPLESATIFTRATGIIRERKFDIGDNVKAGDVLAVVDVPELDRAVEAAKAGVEQATVRANNTRTHATRATALYETRAMSAEESEQRVATAAEAEASVRVARAELARLEEQQKFATVRAPFDGVIAARNFDRGDRVRGDSATADGWLYRLVRVDTLRFVVNATPDLALRLVANTTAPVRFNEFTGKTFNARIARATQVLDVASGTLRVELLIENKDLKIPAGLTGTATFKVDASAGTFLLPANTLMSRNGRAQVAAVEAGKVAFHEVATGRNLGQNVEVMSPALNAMTPIIINPNAMLRAGETVTAAPLAAAN